MKRSSVLLAVLALPLAFGCGNRATPTAAESDLRLEGISEAEILAAGRFEGLTDEQKLAVRSVFRAAGEAIAGIRARWQAGEITTEEAHALARRVHERLLEALSAILTPEQLADLQRPGERPGERPRPPILTDEQIRPLLALRHELAEFAQSLQAKVRAGELTGEEARAQLREALLRFNAAACAILTPEQRPHYGFCAAARG